MADTLLRQWAMLRAIPRIPRKIDAATLEKLLVEEGFSVSTRSIQRDLDSLSTRFPLICDDRDKPYGWSWPKDAIFDVPGMDPPTALTFELAEQFLKQVMPRSTLSLMERYFKQARAVLGARGNSSMADWPDKVRILPRGLKLIPQEVDQRVMDVVYEALLAEKRFQARYRPRDAQDPTNYEVNPLGLVLRDAVTYLVCTLWDYDDIKQLALHRIVEAKLLETSVRRLQGFVLDDYIAEGHFSTPYSGRMIELEALFDPGAAYHLRETKLSEDQVMEDQTNGQVLVKATVRDTGELRWWLLGFGDGVEVLAPSLLLKEVQTE